MPPPVHSRWMTLRRFERENLLSGHPSDYYSLTGGSHTSVIDIKGKSRLNPKKSTPRSNPRNKP
jgi:hypothetical protein